MAPRSRIIIDTDPGVDDTLAMLLAFAAKPEELEVLLISVTWGNIGVQNCLRNVISLLHHIKRERTWRKKNGKPEGFDALRASKPILAVGAEEPLADQIMMADYFHGADGLGGIHSTVSQHPHLTPDETWKGLFAVTDATPEEREAANELMASKLSFIPSKIPAHQEILRILRENPVDSITIVAIGPLTNIALAAATAPETFLRVKEVVVMGGTIDYPGNITPVAEFNTYADSVAAARVYALTSPNPKSTMPPTPPAPPGKPVAKPPPPFLAPYPERLWRQLKVTLFPLDITVEHALTRGTFAKIAKEPFDAGSPLAEWMNAFLSSTFTKIQSLRHGVSGEDVPLSLHDPLCIWYVLLRDSPRWIAAPNAPEDLRVETSGQWTRGMNIIDRRNRRMRAEGSDGEVPGDTGNWLSPSAGNRITRIVGTPGADEFGAYLLQRVFE